MTSSEPTECRDAINHEHACALVNEQMMTLRKSGLMGRCALFACINGDDQDLDTLSRIVPEAFIGSHGQHAATELPTLKMVRKLAGMFPESPILYFHSKGVCYPGREDYVKWRRCMEKRLIEEWEKCVGMLTDGAEMVGAHWICQKSYPDKKITKPYWAGNFWWATAEYIKRLPWIDGPFIWDRRYEAEFWPTSGMPACVDRAPHFALGECV